MVAFKCRPWREQDASNQWFGTDPGDVYHVGLVDDDPEYVLNAKGTNSGFCRDSIKSWDYVAYLKNVSYNKEADTMQTATVVLPSGSSGFQIPADAEDHPVLGRFPDCSGFPGSRCRRRLPRQFRRGRHR